MKKFTRPKRFNYEENKDIIHFYENVINIMETRQEKLNKYITELCITIKILKKI